LFKYENKTAIEIDAAIYKDQYINKAKLDRIAEIKSDLTDIDNQTIRPLRATISGIETVDDVKKLTNLEAKANSLRDELKQLEI
jgi:transcriptional regulator of aromatic amino acid metabolism